MVKKKIYSYLNFFTSHSAVWKEMSIEVFENKKNSLKQMGTKTVVVVTVLCNCRMLSELSSLPWHTNFENW